MPDDPTSVSERLKRFFLDLDARIDSGLFFAGRWFREIWERFTTFMDRFHVAGWKRWCVVEPASEGMTWGLGGLILALALALPAFYETSDEDWLKKSALYDETPDTSNPSKPTGDTGQQASA